MENIKNVTYNRVFSVDESNEKAQELAKQIVELERIQFAKKTAMSNFKAEIDGINEEVSKLSNQITHGYETVTISARYEDDYEKGERIYYDPQSDTEVKREPLNPTPDPSIFDTISAEVDEMNQSEMDAAAEEEEPELSDEELEEEDTDFEIGNDDDDDEDEDEIEDF